jgi:hypothetical protein
VNVRPKFSANLVFEFGLCQIAYLKSVKTKCHLTKYGFKQKFAPISNLKFKAFSWFIPLLLRSVKIVGQKYFSMVQIVNIIYDNFALNFLTKAPRKSLAQ